MSRTLSLGGKPVAYVMEGKSHGAGRALFSRLGVGFMGALAEVKDDSAFQPFMETTIADASNKANEAGREE